MHLAVTHYDGRLVHRRLPNGSLGTHGSTSRTFFGRTSVGVCLGSPAQEVRLGRAATRRTHPIVARSAVG